MKRIYFISLLALLFGCAYGVQQSATTINPARSELIGVGVNNFIMFTGGYSSLLDIYNTNTNTWSQSDLGCVASAAVSVGNYALFHCYNYTSVINVYTSTIHIFNSVSQTWSSKFFEDGTFGPLAISCGEFALIGGQYTSNVWVFNSVDQSWRTIALTRRFSIAECTNNYAIYASEYHSTAANIVNVITGQVTEHDVSYADYGQGIAKAGKFILIAGGAGSPSASNKVDIFNTETQTWSTSQLSSARSNMVSASVGNFAIFAGGLFERNIDVFNANTMTWSTGSLDDLGYDFNSVVVGPYVMIGGGSTTSEYSSRLTVFNSTDQTWSLMYLSSPRFRIGTAATGNIAMWAGGYRDSYSPLIDVVDIYDFTENIVVSPPVAPVAAPVATPFAAPVSGVSSVMPTDDATVRNGVYANNNYALEPTMYIKYSTNPDFTRQIFIKFPLQNLLPVGSSRAVVRLLGYYQSTLGPLNVQCYAVPNNTWSQSTITWNNKPALGALLSSTDIIHPISYYEWDVTSYVTGRQSSGATHVSFAFVRNTPGPDESTVLINSLEADVNRPMLAITN